MGITIRGYNVVCDLSIGEGVGESDLIRHAVYNAARGNLLERERKMRAHPITFGEGVGFFKGISIVKCALKVIVLAL